MLGRRGWGVRPGDLSRLGSLLVGVNSRVRSAVGLTQGGQSHSGLAGTFTGRDLREGAVVYFPEPFLPRGKE